MTDLLKTVGAYMTPENVNMIAGRIGASESNVRDAIGAAVPVLVNALARNGQSEQGASSITGALRQDHDGSLLGQIGEFISGNVSGRQADGVGILEHVLGGRRATVERGVSQTSGLDMAQVARLLPIIAPIVMNALGKIRQERNLDTPEVRNLLEHEARTTESELGTFARLIDRNSDGSITDDLIGIGSRLFSTFGSR